MFFFYKEFKDEAKKSGVEQVPGVLANTCMSMSPDSSDNISPSQSWICNKKELAHKF